MKKLCTTEGHFYTRTSQGECATRCAYCAKVRMPWSRESLASLRAYAHLRLMLR